LIIKLFSIFLLNIIQIFKNPVFSSEKISKNRSVHPRLHKNKEGLELCIGCTLCAIHCPLEIIVVRTAKNPENNPVSCGEAYARTFQIDGERCINCGYCEEACLPGAIKNDGTRGQAVENREKFFWTKQYLFAPE